MCACPGPLPALVLTTRPETEERRSSGGKRCLGRPGRSQLSLHPLRCPSLGLWSLTFLIFSRDFVFPGTWGSSAFPVTAHFSCSLLTHGVHASAALRVPLSLSWGQATAPRIHPSPADAAPVSAWPLSPHLCHAPCLSQPSSAADGDHPPDACPQVHCCCSTCPASAGRTALQVLVVAPKHNPCWGHIYTSRGIWASPRSFVGRRLELPAKYRSRQGKWQTGVALGQHQLQREQESSALFSYTSLDPKTITLRGGT